MDSNWAKKNPTLADAVKTFPKQVFREWLRLRRQGADQFFPSWRGLKRSPERVQVLDLGARLKAGLN